MVMVEKVRKLFPISLVVQELVRFDMQQLENPEIAGIEYQQGELAGFEAREYLLQKFNRTCVYCDARGVPVTRDHVVSKSRGGTNRLSNLVLACARCNDAKGNLPVEVFVTDPDRLKKILARAQSPLRDAAAVNSTRWALWRRLHLSGLPLSTGSGGRTRYNRTRNQLEKSHCNDALAVGALDRILSYPQQVLVARQTGRGSYARTRSDRYGLPRLIFPPHKAVHGFSTGDIVRAVVPRGKYAGTYTGRIAVRSSGSFALRTASFLVPSVNHKYCTLLQRGAGWYFEQR